MILKNGLVFKSDENTLEKLDLRIENGKIKEIGNNLIASKYEELYDLNDKLILPGFINTHTHAAMVIFRGIVEDKSFDDWLFKNIIPLESKLTSEIIYWATLLSQMEMAANGIVAFCDMYMYEEETAKAVADFGMKALLTRGLVDDNGDDGGRLAENLKLYEKWHGYNERIYVGLGPHAPYTCSIEYLKKVCDIAKKENMVVTMHLMENSWEKEKFSINQLLKAGLADIHFLAVHCVHLDDNDINLLANTNTYISHNPSSNLKLGNGIAPIQKMFEKGLKITFGTDGAASNNSLNVLFEARLASLLQKKDNPENMKVTDVLNMLTTNGYNALGLTGGKIKVGADADLVVLDLNTPSFYPKENVINHIIHSTPKVYATMVKGKFLYINGKFPTVNAEEVYKKFTTFYRKVIGTEN
ncbi:amidohydrolase [Thermosipho ferrireducens]|uniref:Amidohydrolase n=1 Tax=Thermosipho ferrireducens TaxID=2571116 RepID=A0ABX7S610_9BACT|nr:amidohydrolase [Thermosipho ferrireducens]QTA38006.1 amidohydrolase [Thermosipho ferrireducens]